MRKATVRPHVAPGWTGLHMQEGVKDPWKAVRIRSWLAESGG